MKASYSTKESYGSVSELRFATTATISTLFSMGKKHAIGNNQSRTSSEHFKAYVKRDLHVFVRSMFKHVASENGPLVLILQSYSQNFIVKYMD